MPKPPRHSLLFRWPALRSWIVQGVWRRCSRAELVYYVSERDGYRCVWARAFDPTAKAPKGEPIGVLHLNPVADGRTAAVSREAAGAEQRDAERSSRPSRPTGRVILPDPALSQAVSLEVAVGGAGAIRLPLCRIRHYPRSQCRRRKSSPCRESFGTFDISVFSTPLGLPARARKARRACGTRVVIMSHFRRPFLFEKSAKTD